MPIRVLSALTPPDASTYAGLVMKLLEATLVFHYQHLTAVTHPTHVVLGDLYTLSQSAVDRLSESAQGTDYPQDSFARSHEANSKQINIDLSVAPLDYLNTLIQTAQTSQGSDPSLSNLVQEIVGDLCQQRYLLQLALRT